jgi:hypothetical protein
LLVATVAYGLLLQWCAVVVNDLENRLIPNDLIIIRNQGVDHGGHVGHQEGVEEPRKHAQ